MTNYQNINNRGVCLEAAIGVNPKEVINVTITDIGELDDFRVAYRKELTVSSRVWARYRRKSGHWWDSL